MISEIDSVHRDLIDELARVIHHPEEARALLLRVGYPRNALPRFDTAQAFWTNVITASSAGLFDGGVRAIVSAAAMQYPENLIFQMFLSWKSESLNQLSFPSISYGHIGTVVKATLTQDSGLLKTGKPPRRRPVHLGASAPRRVRPGDEFVARLTAYHPRFLRAAKEALRQPDAAVYPELGRTSWLEGVRVRVFLSGRDVQVNPPMQEFTWYGNLATVEFDVEVLSGVMTPTHTLLRFDLYIQSVRVARVRVPVHIETKSRWFDKLLSSQQRFFGQPAYQTAYASYEKDDAEVVNASINALTQLAGIDVYKDCLSMDPKEERKPILKRKISSRDVFMLFWSQRAASSDSVTWEWKTALSCRGPESLAAVRIKEPVPVLPPELEEVEDAMVTPKTAPTVDMRYFAVGCVLSVFVAALVVWAFVVEKNLTPDQRSLIRVLLPLASGFLVGSFYGSFTVRTKSLLPGVIVGATGGFAVWLLSAFVLLKAPTTFGIVVRPVGPDGSPVKGVVTLYVGEELKRENTDDKGQAHFSGISSEFEEKLTTIRVEAPGFRMAESKMKATLRDGSPVEVQMIEER